MNAIDGQLHDGATSRTRPARLQFYADGTTVLFADGEELARHPLAGLRISDRLGATPRRIAFPDGGQFETGDNDGVDRALRRHRSGGGAGWIHRLESSYLIAVAALVLVVLLGGLFFNYGVPALSRAIAFNLPQAASASLGKETFRLLDRRLFEPSELEASTRSRIRREFQAMNEGLGLDFELHFRHGGERVGANAFALPDGTVVMTDELVKLAEDDRELLAVLAHETGHVVNRHGLRQVLQHSMITLFLLYVTGDASNLVAALPVVLLQAGYSREFEREADHYTFERLREQGIETARFASILRRIEAENRQRREEAKGAEESIFAYLSTHPPTEERVRMFVEDRPPR